MTEDTLALWQQGILPFAEVKDVPVGTFFRFRWQVEDERDGLITKALTYQIVEKFPGRALFRREHSEAHTTSFEARDKNGQPMTVEITRPTGDESMGLGTQIVPLQIPEGAPMWSGRTHATTPPAARPTWEAE